MKNALIFFLFGALTVVVVAHFYQTRSMQTATAQTRDATNRARDSVAEKLEEWHLTPEEIKSDLAKTGEVVRVKAQAAGEAISDTRVIAVIKAKYILDRDLSALDISVSAKMGEVSLAGGVA